MGEPSPAGSSSPNDEASTTANGSSISSTGGSASPGDPGSLQQGEPASQTSSPSATESGTGSGTEKPKKAKKEYRVVQIPTAEQIVQEDFMNNCAVRAILSGVMGSMLGVAFGIFMGTMDSTVRCPATWRTSSVCQRGLTMSRMDEGFTGVQTPKKEKAGI